MNKKTLKALQGSIRKWEKIVEGTGIDEGVNNCPLCKLFMDNLNCKGCPVAIKIGQGCCAGSPYDGYSKYRNNSYAKKELAFLKSLLPKEAK